MNVRSLSVKEACKRQPLGWYEATLATLPREEEEPLGVLYAAAEGLGLTERYRVEFRANEL